MNYVKLFTKYISLSFIILLVLNLFLTLISYFNIINNTSIFQIIFLVISLFIGSFLIGKNSKKKGWLEGLKFGLIFSLLLLILNLIFFQSFKLSSLIYFSIMIFSSILGSMIGISKRNLDWYIIILIIKYY